MGYPLQAMIKIRTMREDRAAGDLTRARSARREAERVRNEKKAKRERFDSEKEERRDRIYGQVIGRKCTREELDQTKAAVQRIDEEAMLLAKDEAAAQQALEEKEKEMAAAKVRYLAAQKNKEKIVIHRSVWEEEDRLERERAEDLELEEFTGKRVES